MERRTLQLTNALAVAALSFGVASLTAATEERETTQPGKQGQQGTQHAGQQAQAGMQGQQQSHFKASDFIGKDVQNEQGESLGEIEDVVIDLQSHSAPFAIVAYGGTLGLGESRVAVPLSELQYSQEDDKVTLAATREELDSASETPTGAWAAVSGQEWAEDIDRFYGQPSAGGMARFERQPMESGQQQGREFVRDPAQGGKESDNALRQQVSEKLQGEANVQIQVKDGVVTLKGQVDSDAKKQSLEQKIQDVSGVQRIDNQLQVKE